jgi:hypothetical protein
MAVVAKRISVRAAFGVVALWMAPVALQAQLQIQLLPATNQAFDQYTHEAEAQMKWQPRLQPQAGEVLIAPAGNRDASTIEIQSGLIHDWMAAALVPGVRAEKVLQVLESYEDYKNIYAPDVTDSRLLSHTGNRWDVALQLRKQKVFSVILNSQSVVEERKLGEGRWSLVSHSTKMAELDDGKELPAGVGRGFLWRINIYWLLEQRPNGAYLEARAISLSRDVPLGLSWAVRPFLSTVPRESLESTMSATVRAAAKLNR